MWNRHTLFRAEQSRAEQSRAEQSRAEQSRAEQSAVSALFSVFFYIFENKTYRKSGIACRGSPVCLFYVQGRIRNSSKVFTERRQL